MVMFLSTLTREEVECIVARPSVCLQLGGWVHDCMSSLFTPSYRWLKALVNSSGNQFLNYSEPNKDSPWN
jgi:hypothetical protein